MRHRILFFAIVLTLSAAFSAHAQVIEFAQIMRGQSDLRGKKGREPKVPQVMGRVTDLTGRSINAAEITLFCVDSDEVIRVRSNAFGYYQVSGLADGHEYLLSVSHRKYLFVLGSESIVAGDQTFEINFIGESGR